MCSWDTRQMFFGAGTRLFVEPRELTFSPYISRDKLSPGTGAAIQFALLGKVELDGAAQVQGLARVKWPG